MQKNPNLKTNLILKVTYYTPILQSNMVLDVQMKCL